MGMLPSLIDTFDLNSGNGKFTQLRTNSILLAFVKDVERLAKKFAKNEGEVEVYIKSGLSSITYISCDQMNADDMEKVILSDAIKRMQETLHDRRRLTAGDKSLRIKIKAAKTELAQLLISEPTIGDLAHYLKIPEEEILEELQ